MNSNSFRSQLCRTVGLLLIAGVVSTNADDLVLHKVPSLTAEQAPAFPQNLARYHLGANVEAAPRSQPIANLQLSSGSEDQNAAEASLLCNDPTVGYALPSGVSTVLVSLPAVENVGSVQFLNNGVTGEVTVATSNAKLPAESPQWHAAVNASLSGETVRAELGSGEAKYVRLTFNVTKPGRIAGFGVYSVPKMSDFTTPRAHQFAVRDHSDTFALISYNLSDIHAKSRALYVSSGSDARQANNMIDDQTGTVYTFANNDGSPTTVVDLGKPATLRRLSTVYSARAGSMAFYVLQNLPPTSKPASDEAVGGAETLKLDDATFAGMTPIGSSTDDGSRGRAAVDFPAVTGRYVMMRWTPAAQSDTAFSIAEIAAFGAGQGNTLVAANTAAQAQERSNQVSDGKTMLDGKTMIDAKDMPAEGPVEEAPQSPSEGPPPSLPQPPPFTFVPVLVPVSP